MKNLNLVLLSRLGKVALPKASDNAASVTILADWVESLSRLGFVPSLKLLEAVSKNTNAVFGIESALREHMRDVDYVPLHDDFPEYVPNAPEGQLYLSAILHYIAAYYAGEAIVYTSGEAKIRKALESKKPLKVLDAATKDDVRELVNSLSTQGQPFSESDLEAITLLHDEIDKSNTITIRENLAHLFNLDEAWGSQAKTVTDVLRFAAVLSGGHPSLAENVTFRLSRPQRRALAGVLNRVLVDNEHAHEDFPRHIEAWKRLIRAAHFGDYGYPAVNRAVSAVYNETARSFESRLEAAKTRGYLFARELLLERPGVFARQLFDLLAKNPELRESILEDFRKVAGAVSSRVLIQLFDHARGPKASELARTPFFGVSKTASGYLPNKRTEDNADVLKVIAYGLEGRLHGRSFAVKEDAHSIAIPMNVRSASPSSRVLGRGSRIPIADSTKAVRLFMHWTGEGVDLDLSAHPVNASLDNFGRIAYYNLRETFGYHSGDIVSAPQGAAEFVDVDITKALEAGWRYIVLQINSYSGQKLASVDEAWAGVMEREGLNDGENFEPSTVTARFDLTSEARVAVPLIFDLQEREMIWVDRAIHAGRGSNVDNSRHALLPVIQDAVLQPRMTVSEFLALTGAEFDPEGEELDATRADKILNLLV